MNCKDDCNNDLEDGEAVGCREVAKPRTQRNTNNLAAMLDVADGSPNTPPDLIKHRMTKQKTVGVVGDKLGGQTSNEGYLNNFNTLPSSSSSFLSALNPATATNVDIG